MKNNRKILYLPLFIVFFVASCSTKNNTWLSRGYQSFATKYNIRHNAVGAFDEGQAMLIVATQDNYSEVITLYPPVNQSTGNMVASQMNTTIEKCRKAIKLHSIRSKPKHKPLGMSSANYRKFKNQEEFNPQIPKAWLLLGKAEFYKAEFIEAVSAFNYVINHYPEKEDLVYEAKLWKLRAYTEMGWLHEAESHLSQIKASSVPPRLKGTYSALTANLLLAQKRYEEAIPHLKIAIDSRPKSRYEKSRFNFVLAQLYELTGKKNLAIQHYRAAQHNATNYEMIFNANLKAMQLESNNKKAIKGLQAMARSANNKKYLDQVYFAVGERYLASNDTDRAIQNYKLAMTKSLRNGIEKSLVALRLADIYYDKKDYIPSAQYYDSVLVAMPNTHSQYKKAEQRAEILGGLARNYATIQLQDSLLRLSAMSEAEQRKIVDKIIEKLLKAEKEAAKDSADKAAVAVASSRVNDTFDPTMNQQIRGDEWYFYNVAAVNQGKNQFKRKWGNRPLEDNWNREVKSMMSYIGAEGNQQQSTETTDSAAAKNPRNDPHRPEYYLWQIPKTDKDKQQANQQIADAMYDMGDIFYTKIMDIPSADKTYREFQSRFPKDERKAETYYIEYRINGTLNKPDEQAAFRDRLIREYPTSRYAMMLANPNYAANLQKMQQVQNDMYRETYDMYIDGNYNGVKQNYDKMLKDYPLSEHLPRFALLSALSSAKLGQYAASEAELDSIVAKYPESDITPISKDILALIKQGRKQVAQTGTDDINGRRRQEAQTELAAIQGQSDSLSISTGERHDIIFVPKINDKKILNTMLYDIAVYNFNKFMVKDFDFDTRKVGNKELIIVSGMESLEEAKWYKNIILTDKRFAGKNNLKNFNLVIVQEADLAKINADTLHNYIDNQDK